MAPSSRAPAGTAVETTPVRAATSSRPCEITTVSGNPSPSASTCSAGAESVKATAARAIESSRMAAILLDVDGVLHVSGEPIPGAADAVRRLRQNGHRLRFVTNTTIRSRAQLGEELRAAGFQLDDDEVQTAAGAAVRALRGKRVLALTMHALVGDLEG